MPILMTCGCGQAYQSDERDAGKTLDCKGCGKRLTVPNATPAPLSMPPAPPTKVSAPSLSAPPTVAAFSVPPGIWSGLLLLGCGSGLLYFYWGTTHGKAILGGVLSVLIGVAHLGLSLLELWGNRNRKP